MGMVAVGVAEVAATGFSGTNCKQEELALEESDFVDALEVASLSCTDVVDRVANSNSMLSRSKSFVLLHNMRPSYLRNLY